MRKKLAEKKRSSGFADLKQKVFDRVVFQKIRDRFGGKLRYAFSGGAHFYVSELQLWDTSSTNPISVGKHAVGPRPYVITDGIFCEGCSADHSEITVVLNHLTGPSPALVIDLASSFTSHSDGAAVANAPGSPLLPVRSPLRTATVTSPGVAMYGAVLVLAFFSPLAAVFLTFAIAAFYLPSAALFDR